MQTGCVYVLCGKQQSRCGTKRGVRRPCLASRAIGEASTSAVGQCRQNVAVIVLIPSVERYGIVIILVIIIFLNLGRSSRGGGQKLILEIIALMVNHPSGSRQQSSRAAG